MASDPDYLNAARKQLERVRGNAMAFLGWWAAWKAQPEVDNDDLIDLVKSAGLDEP